LKIYNIAFSILLFFLVNKIVAQEKDSIIYWSQYEPLVWADFEGIKTDLSEAAAARSRLQIQVLTSLKVDGNYKCHYFATFNRKKSFTIVNDSLVLNHEQIHFDIQELFVRKMRKYFELLKIQGPQKTSICRDVFNKYYKSLDSLQLLYDAETKHSIEKKSQLDWNREISIKLKALGDYSTGNLYGIEQIDQK
jgi:hypothetical protein